jgi:hypothetical protein
MREAGKAKLNYSVVAVVVLVIAGAIYAGASVLRSHQADAASGQQQTTAEAAQNLRLTLDPNLFVGEVKQAYQVAERDPALLAQLHCYCGCDRTDGHKNLLDCYRDNHGSHCAICTGEAIEADKLAAQGVPVEKIRDALRDRFANGE